MKEMFRQFARSSADAMGSPLMFCIAIASILIWGATGPVYGYSDTWQLVINTATTIVTFLMVFVIQNTQNRDSKSIHLKLDELLRGVTGARTGLMQLEHLTDDQLDELRQQFERLQKRESRRLPQQAQDLESRRPDARER
jgi:low affinity Fe/Cu permease